MTNLAVSPSVVSIEVNPFIADDGKLGEGYTVKTLKEALELLKRGPFDDVEVIELHLAEGFHSVEETIAITREEVPDHLQLKVLGKGAGKTLICGSRSVDNWRNWKQVEGEVQQKLAALPEMARDRVLIATLPEETRDFKVLFAGLERLERAKSDPFKPRKVEVETFRSFNVAKRCDRPRLFEIPAPKKLVEGLKKLGGTEVFFTSVPWQLSILPVDRYDDERELLITKIEGTCPAFIHPNKTGWMENHPSWLKKPGQWVYLHEDRLLVFWPKCPGEEVTVRYPVVKTILRVEGEIDSMGPSDTPVTDVHFSDLAFIHGDRDSWEGDHKGLGIQHDWEKFDRDTSMLRFRGAENCSVKRCRFTASGGTALRLDLHCQNIEISENLIDRVGSMGILLCGYGPGAKDVNHHNHLHNNLIHHCGEVVRHGHAIFVFQSGHNRIHHNTIHHVPRKAIGLNGVRLPMILEGPDVDWDDSSRMIRWHEIPWPLPDDLNQAWDICSRFSHTRYNVVSHNNCYRILEGLGDGGGLNVSGAGEGNVISYNYVHHIINHTPSGAIRTDDWQRGTLIHHNLIYRCNIAAIVRKNRNDLIGNIMVDVSTREHIRFASYPEEQSNHSSQVCQNTHLETGASINYYHVGYASPGMTHPHEGHVDHNSFYCLGNPEAAQGHLEQYREKGVECFSRASDVIPSSLDIFTHGPLGHEELPVVGDLFDARDTGLRLDYPEVLRKLDESPEVDDHAFHRMLDDSFQAHNFW